MGFVVVVISCSLSYSCGISYFRVDEVFYAVSVCPICWDVTCGIEVGCAEWKEYADDGLSSELKP